MMVKHQKAKLNLNSIVIGYSCRCNGGFILNQDGTSCIDEDECRSGIYCRGGRCLNTIGSFQCECPQGSQPSFDRKVFYLQS